MSIAYGFYWFSHLCEETDLLIEDRDGMALNRKNKALIVLPIQVQIDRWHTAWPDRRQQAQGDDTWRHRTSQRVQAF